VWGQVATSCEAAALALAAASQEIENYAKFTTQNDIY